MGFIQSSNLSSFIEYPTHIIEIYLHRLPITLYLPNTPNQLAMGNRKDIMLPTKNKLSGDAPRKSMKFKSLFDGDQNGISVSRDSSDTNYWLNYRYAVGFSLIVGILTYAMLAYILVE